MQLIYLFIDATQSDGVHKKVLSKIKALNELGVKTKGVFINETIKEYKFDKDLNVAYIPLQVTPIPFIYNRRYIRNYLWYFRYKRYYRDFYKQIIKAVEKETFDLLLFRYPLANKQLYKFASKYKNRIVFEHNSKELEELKLHGLSTQLSKYIYQSELNYALPTLNKACGIIGVTNEIVNYQKDRTHTQHLPSLTLSNGIEVDKFELRTVPSFNEKKLKILMVCGVAANWHGVDIVLKSLARYKGEIDINLQLIGNFESYYRELAVNLGITDKVDFLDYLTSNELNEVVNNAHLALGSLALYRIGLSEGATLKVREYMARGIPFVVGYNDVDLEAGDSVSKFYYPINLTDDTSINFDELFCFVKKVYEMPNHNSLMRQYALSKMDFSVKMEALKKFMLSIKNDKE